MKNIHDIYLKTDGLLFSSDESQKMSRVEVNLLSVVDIYLPIEGEGFVVGSAWFRRGTRLLTRIIR